MKPNIREIDLGKGKQKQSKALTIRRGKNMNSEKENTYRPSMTQSILGSK
jgi:hypothetical protein